MTLSRDDAKQLLEQIVGPYAKGDANRRAEKEVYLSKTLIYDTEIKTGDDKIINAPFAEFWLGFIDDEAEANWAHVCRYILIAEKSDFRIIAARFFLEDEQNLEKL